MEKKIGDFTLSINKDDRGRIVVEVWHNESGKTLAVTEVESEAEGEHWAKKTVELSGAKVSWPPLTPAGPPPPPGGPARDHSDHL